MTIGIDIGNYSTKLSNLVNGKINIILNKSSQRSSKTLMSFKDIRYFGDDAYSLQVNNYKNTVSDFMITILNNNYNKLYLFPNLSNPNLSNPNYTLILNGTTYDLSPEYLLAMYLTNINNNLKENNISTDYVTLAVPNNFNLYQNNILLECFKNSGWKNPHIINKSIALGLEYTFYRSGKELGEESEPVLFIDFGETSTELSLIECKSWEIVTKGSETIDSISGSSIKQILYEECKKEYKTKFKSDVIDGSKQSIKIYKELNKIIKDLSINKNSKFIAENINEDQDLIFNLSQTLIENYLENNITNLDKSIKTLLTTANIKLKDIKSIEILGGISRVPFINTWLQEKFKTKIKHTMDAEDSIAKGCCLYSSIISPKIQMKKFSIFKSIFNNITLSCNKKSFTLFKKGDKIPKSKKISINTKKNIHLEVTNGESKLKFLIKVDKKIESMTEVFVVFDVNIDNTIIISSAYYKKKIVIKEPAPSLTSTISDIKEKGVEQKPDGKGKEKEAEQKSDGKEKEKEDKESSKKETEPTSNKKETIENKPTEKIIYQRYNLTIEDLNKSNILKDHFKQYLKLEEKFTKNETKIKHRESLINNLETSVYEFREALDSNKYIMFISPDILSKCEEALVKDLDIFNDYLVDELDTTILEEKYKFYKNIKIAYKKNKDLEKDNNEFIDSIIKKLDYYIHYFDREEKLLDEYKISIEDNKSKLLKFINDTKEENNIILNKKPYERIYTKQDKKNSDMDLLIKESKKIIDDYNKKKEDIKELDEENNKKDAEKELQEKGVNEENQKMSEDEKE